MPSGSRAPRSHVAVGASLARGRMRAPCSKAMHHYKGGGASREVDGGGGGFGSRRLPTQGSRRRENARTCRRNTKRRENTKEHGREERSGDHQITGRLVAGTKSSPWHDEREIRIRM